MPTGKPKIKKRKRSVVDKILKQLTPERIKKEVEAIKAIKLPPDLQKWVEECEKIGGRQGFIWKWIYQGDCIILDALNIPNKNFQAVKRGVFLFHMFTNLIDDSSESKKKYLVESLLSIPFSNSKPTRKLTLREEGYFRFSRKVWEYIETEIKTLPYYGDNRLVFDFDVQQLLNTTRYSFLAYNRPFLINEQEYWMYLPQNMQIVNVLDILTMCSPIENLGKMREIFLYAQKILRIGNDMGTYRREFAKGDFVNGLYCFLRNSVVSGDEELLRLGSRRLLEIVDKKNIEKIFLDSWDYNYDRIKLILKKYKIKNIDALGFLKALEKITFLHLLGKGYI